MLISVVCVGDTPRLTVQSQGEAGHVIVRTNIGPVTEFEIFPAGTGIGATVIVELPFRAREATVAIGETSQRVPVPVCRSLGTIPLDHGRAPATDTPLATVAAPISLPATGVPVALLSGWALAFLALGVPLRIVRYRI